MKSAARLQESNGLCAMAPSRGRAYRCRRAVGWPALLFAHQPPCHHANAGPQYATRLHPCHRASVLPKCHTRRQCLRHPALLRHPRVPVSSAATLKNCTNRLRPRQQSGHCHRSLNAVRSAPRQRHVQQIPDPWQHAPPHGHHCQSRAARDRARAWLCANERRWPQRRAAPCEPNGQSQNRSAGQRLPRHPLHQPCLLPLLPAC